jgi:hypothetical protein
MKRYLLVCVMSHVLAVSSAPQTWDELLQKKFKEENAKNEERLKEEEKKRKADELKEQIKKGTKSPAELLALRKKSTVEDSITYLKPMLTCVGNAQNGLGVVDCLTCTKSMTPLNSIIDDRDVILRIKNAFKSVATKINKLEGREVIKPMAFEELKIKDRLRLLQEDYPGEKERWGLILASMITLEEKELDGLNGKHQHTESWYLEKAAAEKTLMSALGCTNPEVLHRLMEKECTPEKIAHFQKKITGQSN